MLKHLGSMGSLAVLLLAKVLWGRRRVVKDRCKGARAPAYWAFLCCIRWPNLLVLPVVLYVNYILVKHV